MNITTRIATALVGLSAVLFMAGCANISNITESSVPRKDYDRWDPAKK